MLETYKNRMTSMGGYDGEARRKNAQKIMDVSWLRDPATKPVYVKWVDNGLPNIEDYDIPIYAKYNVKSYHNITGDEISYLLQFRLEDMIANPDIKVGSYVQIPNEKDQMEWWLIVHEDDRTQFRQFSILKCTWTYKWVSTVNGKRVIYSCLGAPRKQNSYNSGVWLDYTTQTVENQEVMWLPTNDDTKTIQYDTKFLKSSPGRYPALKWSITKIEDTATAGITKFTVAQTQFDPVKDNCELMIADYWDSAVEPVDPITEDVTVSTDFNIVYSGSPSVKAGGGYKKFTLKKMVEGDMADVTDPIKWNVNNVDITPNIDGTFSVKLGDKDAAIIGIINSNVLKIKCADEYSLIRESFDVTAVTDSGSVSVVVEVTSL